jgi:hypothetical protein
LFNCSFLQKTNLNNLATKLKEAAGVSITVEMLERAIQKSRKDDKLGIDVWLNHCKRSGETLISAITGGCTEGTLGENIKGSANKVVVAMEEEQEMHASSKRQAPSVILQVSTEAASPIGAWLSEKEIKSGDVANRSSKRARRPNTRA